MSRDRFVALGLAPVRTAWFTEVARWATSATVPLEFVKCLSTDEVVARLRSGRRWSALVADGTVPGLDRDLLGLAREQGCAVLVVDDPHLDRDWVALGAAAVLPHDFGPADLAQALEVHAHPLLDPGRRPGPVTPAPAAWRGSLVGVTGTGGVGTSTLAQALAHGLATDPRHRGLVLLADLAHRASQGLLHDARQVVPGLPELVDAHRSGVPDPVEVTALTHAVADGGYRLLLGLRRRREWAALRPRALDATLDSLLATHRIVVTDVDADVEGERECGSVEVEERNLLARRVASRADLLLVVARPGLTGLHALCLALGELLTYGVPAERLQPVVNRAGRSPRGRAEITRTLAELVRRSAPGGEALPGPVFVGERRGLDDLALDRRTLPDGLVRPLCEVVSARLGQLGPRAQPQEADPEPVAVGSLGSWAGGEQG